MTFVYPTGIPVTRKYNNSYSPAADVEVISPDRIEEAYDRTVKSDVRYRFVIDMQNA